MPDDHLMRCAEYVAARRGPDEYSIITSRAVRARYAAVLEEQSRQRHAAAFEWTRLRWWQWRKRRRLYRVLFGIGGWSIERIDGLPERAVLTRFGGVRR